MPSKHKQLKPLNNQIDDSKRTAYNSTTASYKTLKPVWAFSRMDRNSRWQLDKCDNLLELINKLRSYEGMTWQQIEVSSGGKSHGSNSHFEYVKDLCKEARERAIELQLGDQVFSLRLTGRERLYGVIEQGVFYLLWYDKSHEIYPLSD